MRSASFKADVVSETEAMSMFRDFPFEDCAAKADALAAAGHEVYQKFTCAGCGARLTMGEPNTFHVTGSCDKCNVITDIQKQGCNFMVHMRMR
jgi:hypothetical protein